MLGTPTVTRDNPQQRPLSSSQASPSNTQYPPESINSLRQDITASNSQQDPDSQVCSALHLNCHVSKSVTLSILNSSFSYQFLLLQEPWVNPFDLRPPQHSAWRSFVAYEHIPQVWND
jgi:hypothetical protein